MSDAASDALHQIDQLLSQSTLAWILGAGASLDAGLPLMEDLTKEVLRLSIGTAFEPILLAIRAELSPTDNIEQMLSQLGDYIALTKRGSRGSVEIGGIPYTLLNLENAHREVISRIATVIRYGYIRATETDPERIGSRDNLIVSVAHHADFMNALFEKRQAGVREPRKPVHFFTTNYDTLIEDALSLGRYKYWDGFSGGSIAFRDHRFGKSPPSDGIRAKVIKLHGSIDWILGDDGDVWRVRHTDTYPNRNGSVYIYPQATKYISTQRDPFAAQFSILRDLVGGSSELALAICGYSFSDDHINDELERALSASANRSTVIAFCREKDGLPATLRKWLASDWGSRVYVLTQNGIYWGKLGPLLAPAVHEHPWWSFSGVTTFLRDGGAGHTP